MAECTAYSVHSYTIVQLCYSVQKTGRMNILYSVRLWNVLLKNSGICSKMFVLWSYYSVIYVVNVDRQPFIIYNNKYQNWKKIKKLIGLIDFN